VILHGAGSGKENHYDFARQVRAAGLAAIAFDLRGHGDSEGALDGRVGYDIAAVARLLGDGPLALRGSSLGAYLALTTAGALGARAVVAICPAPAAGLRRGVRDGRFPARIDAADFDTYLLAHDESSAVATLSAPLMVLHAEGDEIVPVELSRALFGVSRSRVRRLVTVPGGHHRSVQHDPDLQALSLRFLTRALADGDGAAPAPSAPAPGQPR